LSDNNQLTKSQMSVEAVLLHHADWKDFKAVILTPPLCIRHDACINITEKVGNDTLPSTQHMQSYPHCRLYDKQKESSSFFTMYLIPFLFRLLYPLFNFQQVEVTANHLLI